MTVTEVRRKPDMCFSWEFDGTQQSVDDLQAELNGTDSNVIVQFVSSTEARSQNPGMSGWNFIGVNEAIVFVRAGNGTSVIMGSQYATMIALEADWEEV